MSDRLPPAAPARVLTMMPRAFAADFIQHWEDGGSTNPDRTHSLDPVDNGNWTGGRQGLGVLVGSNHGVTAAALAAHRNVPVATITRALMHGLTIGEAADIATGLYYDGPRLSSLSWNRVVASVMDMGWGAGPAQAIKLLQRLVGAGDDGVINADGETVHLVAAWLARRGEANAAVDYAAARNDFYDRIIAKRPANAVYRNGWRARTAYYVPTSACWARAA